MFRHNLKPLTYTYRPIERTKIGQINIDNLKGLGVDHIEYSVNPKIEKELIKRSFKIWFNGDFNAPYDLEWGNEFSKLL